MKHISKRHPQYAALIPALLAVSACSPTGFSAGAPSEHIPQSYEETSSTAASTSTLGGSAIRIAATPGSVDSLDSVATSGSVTHDTGRIELDDGTYLFIDADGFDVAGALDDGAGATGARFDTGAAASFTGSYAYVIPYSFEYLDGTVAHTSAGAAGIVTASSDMPSGGSAVYSGESSVLAGPTGGASLYNYANGESTVTVDFGAGTVDVLMGAFAEINRAGVIVAAADAPLDQVQGTGLLISGVHFTGGNWVTLKDGVVVNAVGAGAVITSNGTFFGYDASISGPDEVAGVVSALSPTGLLAGIYIAD